MSTPITGYSGPTPIPDDDAGTPWLILTHQLPQELASLRVKIWRRLQRIGAVAIKNSMYVLPLDEETREDFEWVLREIVAGGAEGALLESRLLGGMTDREVRALFDEAREADYVALADELRGLRATLSGERLEPAERRDAGRQLRRMRKRLGDVEAIDFFGANGREAVGALLEEVTARLTGEHDLGTQGGPTMQGTRIEGLQGKTWVTRRDVHVDRIASAWLVRRFIDAGATFRFVAGKRHVPGEGEVRFDMFEAEYTHEGDKCTFEVLLERASLEDPALRHIAEIVHDIDLKDEKYGRAETAGVANLFAGIVVGCERDDERLERGATMLDDLHRSFQR